VAPIGGSGGEFTTGSVVRQQKGFTAVHGNALVLRF
tara:strand:+ start:5959 stop:6066 length:108 start_codon:yes stop_codon:yes gene_type:complete